MLLNDFSYVCAYFLRFHQHKLYFFLHQCITYMVTNVVSPTTDFVIPFFGLESFAVKALVAIKRVSYTIHLSRGFPVVSIILLARSSRPPGLISSSFCCKRLLSLLPGFPTSFLLTTIHPTGIYVLML